MSVNLSSKVDSLRAKRWARPAGIGWMIACLAVGGYLSIRPESRAATSGQMASSGLLREPIEQITVGERVVTPQTTPGVPLPTTVDPATWKQVSLQMETHYPNGLVDTMRVVTLQPPSWLAEHRVGVGARVPIPLDLKEMGVPDQLAEVTGVSACPPIEVGPGRVVLTTVNHLNSFLFDLSVQGERAPPSLVTVTGWHKFYSKDRSAWVSVCELKTGERMRGRDGPLMVAGLIRHPGTETVYNMTVEGEHQYYVADVELLAHNNSCLPDDHVVVKGGTNPPPPPGTVYSGAHGATLEQAAAGVPHGQVQVTTAGGIRASGGTVEINPEYNPNVGQVNEQHVDINDGPGGSPMSPPQPNPVPKPERFGGPNYKQPG